MMEIMTIFGVLALAYVVLLVLTCIKAENEQLMTYNNLRFAYDNDGRRMATLKLNDVYSVHVMEFSEGNCTYYIVNIWKDKQFYRSVDYCTRDEVSDLMERLQTLREDPQDIIESINVNRKVFYE